MLSNMDALQEAWQNERSNRRSGQASIKRLSKNIEQAEDEEFVLKIDKVQNVQSSFMNAQMMEDFQGEEEEEEKKFEQEFQVLGEEEYKETKN